MERHARRSDFHNVLILSLGSFAAVTLALALPVLFAPRVMRDTLLSDQTKTV